MNIEGSTRPTWASFYDFYDAAEYRQGQLQMYCQLAAEAGGPVLELACGTGIITFELARAGFEVTGLDISPEMLAVAREKLAREAPAVRQRVTLVEGDMKRFDLGARFAFIFVAANTFAWLAEREDHESCLRSIYDHLQAGALAVIEERFYPPGALMSLWERRLIPRSQTSKVNPATGQHTTYTSVIAHIDFVTQTILGRSYIEEVQEDGTVKRYFRGDGTSRHHYFNRFELQLLIERAGLVVRDVWGSHDRRPLGPHSYNMIFITKKGTDPQ